ncbi:hypothetical protein ANT2_0618 [plant metagenome]|uniref:Uncharacterized protein n=1 Tax=plant metagenome TaxID=1297885 RepID=A0A484R6B5_9ZZZZ
MASLIAPMIDAEYRADVHNSGLQLRPWEGIVYWQGRAR